MDVFDRPDYYPSPSSRVIVYKKSAGQKGQSRLDVLHGDIYALVVNLTSPVDGIDYSFMSDFFLVYRHFVSSVELYNILISRFKWAIRDLLTNEKQTHAAEIARSVIIRTFVLIRHGVLNHFTEDFLFGSHLSKSFTAFLNEDWNTFSSRLIKGCIVNLKKAWIYCLSNAWDGIQLDLPKIQNIDCWIKYQVPVKIPRTTNKRLTLSELQRISSPDVRNQSMLSLFSNEENFKLPSNGANPEYQISRRTTSALLFPKDYSNTTEVHSTPKTNSDTTSQSRVKREHDGLSRISHVSSVIKDVPYPNTSKLGQILPPTPAKTFEITVDAPYTTHHGHMSEKTGRQPQVLLHQKSMKHKGVTGLLEKWRSVDQTCGTERIKIRNPSSDTTEMDKIVKYVISIKPIETHMKDPCVENYLNDTKIDILSARTIDEIQYLFQMRSQLVQEMSTKLPEYEHNPNSDLVMNIPNDSNEHLVSAMDNLDIYRVVNSVARSVMTLSETLNNNENLTKFPYMDIIMKRQVHSAMALMGGNVQNSIQNNTNRNSLKPQRLSFHSGFSRTTSVAHADKPGSNLGRRSSSPLRKILSSYISDSTDLKHHSLESKALSNSYSRTSSITYDSELSLPNREGCALPHIYETGVIPRKVSHENLREFTFEANKENYGHDKVEHLPDINEMSNDGINGRLKSSLKGTSPMLVRPASGRISISRRLKNSINNHSYDKRHTLANDSDYIEKKLNLKQRELELLELERSISRNTSLISSVDTNHLLDSRLDIPSDKAYDNNERYRLSKQPTIVSIVSDGDFSLSSMESSSPMDIPSSGKQLTNHSGAHIFSDESSSDFIDVSPDKSTHLEDMNKPVDKYFFVPDNSSINIASPKKNIEPLKDKFIGSGNSHNESVTNIETDHAKMLKSMFKESPIKTSVNGKDPITDALMKLEGIYDEHERDENESLTNEVEVLAISNFPTLNTNSKDKRRSLLIQRRRQTINYIYSASSSDTDGIDNGFYAANKEKHPDILTMFDNYQINHPTLLLANAENHVPFILMYDSLSIAQQLTLIEREVLSEIDWKDLLELKITYEGPDITSWLQLLVRSESLTGIDIAISRFNLTVDWVVSEVVLTRDLKIRRDAIRRFLHIANHCSEMQNYNTLMQIVLALNSNAVQKFKEAWRLIDPSDLLLWERLKKLTSLHNNYSAIRNLLNSLDPIKGCVPFLVVYLSDLSLNAEKNDWIQETPKRPQRLVNFGKYRTNVRVVKSFVQRVQWAKFYRIKVDHELLSKCVYLTCLTPREIDILLGYSM